jgi:hypothetical protein
LLVKDADIGGNGRAGKKVIARDDNKVNARLIGVLDNVFDVATQGVFKGDNGEESLFLSLESRNLLIIIDLTVHFGEKLLEVVSRHVTVREGKATHALRVHPGVTKVKDILLVVILHVVLLGVGSLAFEVLRAVRDNNFRGTLDENADGIVAVVLGKLDGNDRLLEGGAEGNGGADDAGELLLHVFMDGLFSALKPLNERYFGSLAFWDIERVLAHLDVGA